MQRIALSSLYAVSALFALACSAMDLTVGEKNSPAGKGDAGSASENPPAVLPGTGGGHDRPSAGGAAGDPPHEPEKEPPLTSFFSCGDGTKIDARLRCSGAAECPDGSDEASCSPPAFVCKGGDEIEPALVCDGNDDCGDESDELDCPEPPFVCDDQSTVDSTQVCDHVADCADRSDEFFCPEYPFECANGTLIYRGLVCDGKDQCGDGSDELECGDPPPFACNSGGVILGNLVCSGKAECEDGSDEQGCSTDCQAGVDLGSRLDEAGSCWGVLEPIGCAQLLYPSSSVPANFADTQCLVRKRDGAIFLVPEPQPKSEWQECSESQRQQAALATPCLG